MKKAKSVSSKRISSSARQIKPSSLKKTGFDSRKTLFSKKGGFTIKKVLYQTRSHDSEKTLDTLEHAWKNLPSDFSYEERVIFLEIAEKIVKVHHQMQDLFDEDINRMKN